MTSEQDFLAIMAADPSDFGTRLVFADWLQDRDDPRAPAYRWLATRRRHPDFWVDVERPFGFMWWPEGDSPSKIGICVTLPNVWYSHLDLRAKRHFGEHEVNNLTCRQAEVAAVQAYLKLPANWLETYTCLTYPTSTTPAV